MDLANLQKRNETNIYPVRTETSSIKVLLLWLYSEFADDSIAHLYRRNARATKKKRLFFYASFSHNAWSDNKRKIFI